MCAFPFFLFLFFIFEYLRHYFWADFKNFDASAMFEAEAKVSLTLKQKKKKIDRTERLKVEKFLKWGENLPRWFSASSSFSSFSGKQHICRAKQKIFDLNQKRQQRFMRGRWYITFTLPALVHYRPSFRNKIKAIFFFKVKFEIIFGVEFSKLH